MPTNFLQAFAPFASQPAQPNPMEMLGELLAGRGQPTAPAGPTSNVLQQLSGNAPIAAPAPGLTDRIANATAGFSPPEVSTGRRRSLLDIVGGLSDVIARVGGAEALYQPQLDAREDRRLALEDRNRQIDMQDLEKKLREQNLQMGGLQIEGAQDELQNTERERIGMALGSIANSENPAEDWMAVAQEAGIDPVRAQAIGQRIQANPGIVGSLATTFGYEPPRAGSQAKELQVYSLLQSQNPELAAQYLQSVANPESMSAYQQAQLALALEKFGFDKYKFENPQPTAAERTATAERAGQAAQQQELASSGQAIIDQLRNAFGRLRDAGGINAAGQNFEQRAGAAIYQNVPGAERLTNPEGFSAREDIQRLRTVGIPSLLPLMGGLTLGGRNMDAAKELETWQRAIASASDYESAIRALDMIEGRIKAIQARPATPPAAPRSSAPRPRDVRNPPAVGEIYTRPDGSKWKRTGPGRYDWQKVS